MKTTILIRFVLFLALISLLLAFSCERCDISAEMLLTEQQKNNNPFKGSEKIVFSEGIYIIEFSGDGRINWIDEVPVSLYSCDYSLYEQDKTIFKSDNFVMDVLMLGRDHFSINIEDISNDFTMRSRMKMDQSTGDFSNYQEFIEILYVNNKQYNNIYRDTLTKSNLDPFPDSVTYAVNIYYSTDFGTIKVDFSDGSTWELQEIIWQE